MPKKLRFKPVINRIKLNPEQAVLACECYGTAGGYWTGATRRAPSSQVTMCDAEAKPGTQTTKYGALAPCTSGANIPVYTTSSTVS